MLEKEEAPASGGTLTEAEEEMTVEMTSISLIHATTDNEEMQAKVEDLLLHGKENAIPTRRLMELAGFTTARKLQKQVERERAAGALILSASTGGYYLPADGEEGRAEIRRYERTLHNRAISTLRTLRAARRALRECCGQTEIAEVEDHG